MIFCEEDDASMDPALKIVEVTRLGQGIIVGFADGEMAIYSQALLRQMLPQAEKIMASEEEEPDDGASSHEA